MPGFVFISYKRVDEGYVQRLAQWLQQAECPTWYDLTPEQSLAAGDHFARVIEERIRACAAMIVVLTPESLASVWVHKEVSYAVSLHKPLVPLILRECDPGIMFADLHQERVVGGGFPSASLSQHLVSLTAAVPPAARRPERSLSGLGAVTIRDGDRARVLEEAERQHRTIISLVDQAIDDVGKEVTSSARQALLSAADNCREWATALADEEQPSGSSLVTPQQMMDDAQVGARGLAQHFLTYIGTWQNATLAPLVEDRMSRCSEEVLHLLKQFEFAISPLHQERPGVPPVAMPEIPRIGSLRQLGRLPMPSIVELTTSTALVVAVGVGVGVGRDRTSLMREMVNNAAVRLASAIRQHADEWGRRLGDEVAEYLRPVRADLDSSLVAQIASLSANSVVPAHE